MIGNESELESVQTGRFSGACWHQNQPHHISILEGKDVPDSWKKFKDIAFWTAKGGWISI
jgi:hypothetical protein